MVWMPNANRVQVYYKRGNAPSTNDQGKVVAAAMASYMVPYAQSQSHKKNEPRLSVTAPLSIALVCRNGNLLWSEEATWSTRPGGKPQAGQNVTIPNGWNLVIDESPPALQILDIHGNVTFSKTANITLTAAYILVRGTGQLSAGTAAVPHPTGVTLAMSGTRATPWLGIRNDLIIGAKVCAALVGSTGGWGARGSVK
jgi:hypothetical protein